MNTLVIAIVVKASLLIGVAAAINLLLRRRTSAATRHLVWTLALSGVLLLPVLSVAVPTWGIPIHVKGAVPASMLTSVEAAEESPVATQAEPLAAPAGSLALEAGDDDVSPAPLPRTTSWPSLALLMYLAGVSLLGLNLALGRLALRRLVRDSAEVTDPEWVDLLRECESRMGVTQPVRLLRSLDRSMPMAFGLRTPTILIPAVADTWSEDRRRAVLLHELAHIERRDCFTQLLAAVTCAAYWMHPGVWWVAKRLRVERELACDDRVLSVGTVARDYAGHLLELAYSLGGYRSPALVVSMARPRQLEGRMLALLDVARNRVSPPLRARVIGFAAATMVVVPLAAAEAVLVTEGPVTPAMVEWSEPAPSVEPQASTSTSTSPSTFTRSALATYTLTVLKSQTATTQDERERQREREREEREREREAEREARDRERTREIKLPGTWEMRTSEEAGKVYLQLSERPNSQHGFMIPLDQLDGLAPSMLSSGGAAKFNIRRDAGTIVFDGVFRSGVGAGTFDFTPSPTFGAEMAKRGFESPNAVQQYQLARGNVGFAYLDELNAQKYEKPSLEDLVRAAQHGVHLDYLRGMGSAGYRLGRIEALVRTRDHGVSLEYIRALAEEGIKNLPVDDLVRARDHGVTAQYIGTMRAFGYSGLPLEELIKARDHGVSGDYIRGMAESGYNRVPLKDLVRARDHGVSADFVKAMREAGYGALTLDELVNARDHGVNGDYIRGMASLGPERPSLDELVSARDRGVNPEFARAWRDLGYPPALADMVRAREHGVNAEYIKELKALGYERLSVDELVRLRDHGVTTAFVRDQNSGRSSRMSVEELVRRRSGRM